MKTSNRRMVTWEGHLVERAVKGDAVAFEMLADLHRPGLSKLAMRVLRNGEDANDAVQEALVKAMRAIGSFDPDRPIKPWLYRICSNCCVDAMRDRRRDGDSLDGHEFSLADPKADIDDQAVETMESDAVREAIVRLPARYKEIIVMRHFRHMEVAEIANHLKKPEGTIKSWLFRARALLKKDLQVALG